MHAALPPRDGKVKLDFLASRAFESVRRSPPWDNHEPIREELFSVERLEEHARSLALAQIVSSKTTKGQPLARRLADNGAVLLEAYRAIVKAINEGRAITPAAEWLVDNYHLVEKQIREIRSDLPPGYYRQLPKLASGPFAGYPRVFGVAWAFVAHTDSRFDPEMLCRFVSAYQEVQPLTIGELWAVAITLRIVLVENLRRLAQQITQQPRGAAARRTASPTACSGSADDPPSPSPSCLPHHERAPLADAFAVQLVHRLRDQDPRITPALTWLDQRLAIQGTTAETVVRDEHQRQGAANVTVRNIITSMRLISDVDWPELFEQLSLVDAVLRRRRRVSRTMDFPTRNALPQRDRGAGARLEAAPNWTSRGAAVLAASRERQRSQRPSRRGAAIPAII